VKLHLLIAALPIMLVLPSCKTLAPAISHPPIVDLNCPAEPQVAAMLARDPTGLEFDMAVREAGEQCRQALARVCRWHKERGAEVSCPATIR
jgi:hypothetical protein